MENISQLLLITAPMVLLGVGLIVLVRYFLQRDKEIRLLELRMAEGKETRLLRLQAYERMTLLLERIAPGAVIARVMEPDMQGSELQLAMIRMIRSEFEHNLSQQIYISSNAWHLAVSARDEIIKTIGLISQKVAYDVPAQQLARIILEAIANSGQPLPNQTALEFLKAEAKELF
ncbi:MAG: hypothetical protein U0T73_00360 [Chitinophagales bacterium]